MENIEETEEDLQAVGGDDTAQSEASENDSSSAEETVADTAAGEAVSDEAPASAPVNPNMKWYILHTYSSYEKRVRDTLRERLRQLGMADKVGEILVPEEDVVEVRSGKKRVSKRKFFPGYVVIEMEMDEDIWYAVKETQRVTGFLGDKEPVPLSPDEVARLREQLSGAAEKPRPKYAYDVGEHVRVTAGPFANFSGVLEEVNPERGKVKVMVSIFGRSTPVELEFSQIEKV